LFFVREVIMVRPVTDLQHLSADLEVCTGAAERLAAKASLSEDDAKARFSSDLLDAVRERRQRVQHALDVLRTRLNEGARGEMGRPSTGRPWNSQTTSDLLR
jgi:hypothetical protein